MSRFLVLQGKKVTPKVLDRALAPILRTKMMHETCELLGTDYRENLVLVIAVAFHERGTVSKVPADFLAQPCQKSDTDL